MNRVGRNLSIILHLAIIALVGLGRPNVVDASTFRTDDNIHLSNLHVIDDDFYANGENVTVDGIVTGDLISGAYDIDINGEIGGSANLGCYLADHSGRINGSLRCFSNNLKLDGHVGGSVLGFCNVVKFGTGAVIEGDVHLRCGTATLGGIIQGDVDIIGKTVKLGGVIEGDVSVKAKSVSLIAPAIIRGNLTYRTPTQDALKTASGVTVTGNVIWEPPDRGDEESEDTALASITLTIARFLAAFFFGIIIVYLFRPYAEETLAQLHKRTHVSFAAGLLGLVLLIACLLILMFTLVGWLVGRGLLGGEHAAVGVLVVAISTLAIPITGFLSVTGGILLYSGKIVTAFLLGQLVIRPIKPNAAPLSKSGLLAGLVILTILMEIPYLGPLVQVAAALIGSGAIILGIRHCHRVGSQPVTIETKTDLAS